jgi:hypothetical protein
VLYICDFWTLKPYTKTKSTFTRSTFHFSRERISSESARVQSTCLKHHRLRDAQRTPSRATNDLLPRAHSDLEAIALGGVRSRARPVAAPSRVGGSARGEPNVPLSRPRVSREFFECGR